MADDIRTRIAEELNKINPRVQHELIEAVVSKEAEKRVAALVSVLNKLEKEEKDFNKLGADIVEFDEKGKKIGEGRFSKKRVDERNKAQGRIQKLTNAINKAIDKDDYGDVYNLASGKDTGEDKAGTGGSSDTDTD